MDDRWVEEGGLGCPNCREVYPITHGVADLRVPPRRRTEPVGPDAAPSERELDVAHALLGVIEGPGDVATVGTAARFAAGLARAIPGVDVIAATAAPVSAASGAHVSRVVVGPRLPFRDRGLRGVLLEGRGADGLLREAARILAPGHRVVVLDASPRTPGKLIASGLTVRLDEQGVVVAGR